MKELIIALVSVLLFEHFGRLYEWRTRPSLCIDAVANVVRAGADWLAYWFFWASSFLEFLRADKFAESCWLLAQSCARAVLSPLWVVVYYLDRLSNYTSPKVVIAGSVILVALVLFVLWRRIAATVAWLWANFGKIVALLVLATPVFAFVWRESLHRMMYN